MSEPDWRSIEKSYLWQYWLKVGHKDLMLFTATIDKSFSITKFMLISHPLNSCIAETFMFWLNEIAVLGLVISSDWPSLYLY